MYQITLSAKIPSTLEVQGVGILISLAFHLFLKDRFEDINVGFIHFILLIYTRDSSELDFVTVVYIENCILMKIGVKLKHEKPFFEL